MPTTIREDLAKRSILLTDEAYARALQSAPEATLELIEYLIEAALIDKALGCRIWSDRIGYAYVDPIATLISAEALACVPREIACKATIVPLYAIDGVLTVAMPDPHNQALISRLVAITGRSISPVFCLAAEVREAIDLYYSSEKSVKELIDQLEQTQAARLSQLEPEELSEWTESESIIGLCDALILLAIKERASDIHIEPGELKTLVRLRIDGRLQAVLKMHRALYVPLKSRIKILCNMNIAETRLPQDGRFSVPLGESQINFRVSAIPTIHGEKIVLRLLALTGKKDFKSLEQMLMPQSILQPWQRIIQSPNGMIFVTGPTGSGKSTTLYASLHEINSEAINICTIEDPVETKMAGVVQSQVNESIGLSFASLLRSLLRQDPDVMLVGEIRDLETAKIATEAALTGHLVFSTLHTNNAIQAIVRLVELGIEPYMVAPSILAVLAQRLTARICDNCKVAYTPAAEVLSDYFYDAQAVEPPLFYHGAGCACCRQTGYYGRVALHELVLVTSELRELIAQSGSDAQLTEAAMKAGYRPLCYDGLRKVLLGLTTMDELRAQAFFN